MCSVCVCVCVCVQLLAEGLCAKHDLELSDFATHTETRPSEREERVEEMERDEPTVDTGNSIHAGKVYHTSYISGVSSCLRAL